MHCVLTLSCPTFCNPVDRGPSSVHGILQARILEWVAVSFSRRSSQPRGRTNVSCISCTGRLILYHWVTWQLHRCIYWSSHQPTYLRYVHFIINYILIFYLKKEYYWKWMNNIFFTKKKTLFKSQCQWFHSLTTTFAHSLCVLPMHWLQQAFQLFILPHLPVSSCSPYGTKSPLSIFRITLLNPSLFLPCTSTG